MAESAPSQAALALTARAAPQAAAPENQFKIVRETLLSSDRHVTFFRPLFPILNDLEAILQNEFILKKTIIKS